MTRNLCTKEDLGLDADPRLWSTARHPDGDGDMHDPKTIAMALADALPRDACRRMELIAIGMVATALIAGTHEDEQQGLVDDFCAILRESILGRPN